MKIGINCDACGLDDWIEYTRFFNFDTTYENITYRCLNCGHIELFLDPQEVK